MDQVKARLNGEYTCLDCRKQCSNNCLECFNWHLFKLDERIHALPYGDRSKRNERKQKEWTAKRLKKTLERESEITSKKTV